MQKNRGFTLIELIIVLAIIGMIAAVILPALRRSTKSELMDGINHLSAQVKLTYDAAIFTGRIHRMVFDTKNSTFWTEIAPNDFTGRAPNMTAETENRHIEKQKILSKFIDEAKSANNTETPILEIPVQKMDVLKNISWTKLNTTLISEQRFAKNLVFVQITTDLAQKPVQYSVLENANETTEAYLSYVYFFPSGVTTQASFQIGFLDERGNIDNNALKYTAQLNTFTGQLKLLQGFQGADFEVSQ